MLESVPMRGGFSFDDSTPPLVVARLWGALTDEQFRAYLLGYEAIMARGNPVVILIDARQVEPASASQRKMQADWLIVQEPRVKALLLGMAFVIGSPVVRAIITAVFWFKPLPCPHVVTATMHEGHEWAAQICARRGISLAPLRV